MTGYEPVDLAAVRAFYTEEPGSIDLIDDSAITELACYVPGLVREVEALRERAEQFMPDLFAERLREARRQRDQALEVNERGYQRYAELHALYVDCLAARDAAVAA